MQWMVMDMTNMTFDANSFDIIIDKASMDALAVNEKDVWSPDESVVQSIHRMCTDISRILKHNGLFLSLSFAQPHFRTKYLYGSRINNNTINSPYKVMKGYCEQYDWALGHEIVTKETGIMYKYNYNFISTNVNII